MAQRYATAADLPDEFDGTPPGDIALWLGVCEQYIGLTAWGEKASTGRERSMKVMYLDEVSSSREKGSLK